MPSAGAALDKVIVPKAELPPVILIRLKSREARSTGSGDGADGREKIIAVSRSVPEENKKSLDKRSVPHYLNLMIRIRFIGNSKPRPTSYLL
jgi:hypothetical protein